MQKEKVMVIDDEELILQLSKDILTNYNYEVRTISDGNEGMGILEREKFDLLLIDIRMPGVSGMDVIKHVRASDKEIPIIIITAHGTLDIATNALRLGAQGFILKPFTPDELRLAVAEALEKTRLIRENISMRALMPLFEVSKGMIGEIDPKKLMKEILGVAVKETHADKACVYLVDETTGKLCMKEEFGLSTDFCTEINRKYIEKIAAFIFKERSLLIVAPEGELPSDFEELRRLEGASYGIYVPLTIRGNVIGILYIGRTSGKHPFSRSEVELVSVLGGQAAAAIENARLYEKLQQSYLSMIVTLSGVVEARDLYTDKHMKDIAEYSVEIAQKLKLSDSDIEDIRKAALLHDLGKICVPDHILMKADKLSDDEMDIIKRHPVAGAKIIESVEPIKQAREIIKHHHEYYDGTGYPDGLGAQKIPLGARIISVADAFGAMTTDRPYRKALSIGKAIDELKEFAGTQFDPEIVDIFISILREKGILGNDNS
jgi:putative nucleotidyltransferase with HDIG domain